MMKRKSLRSRLLTMAVAVVLLAATTFALVGCGESIDYVASLKTWKPFASTQNIDASINQVMNKYISSQTWTENELGDRTATVTVKGTIKTENGTSELTIVFGVSPGPSSDTLSYKVNSATLDGDTLTGGDASDFLFIMFDAYDEDWDTLDEYINYWY